MDGDRRVALIAAGHSGRCSRPNGEVKMMIVSLTSIAIVTAGVPLAAVVLVTVASRQEETARSIAGRAPGSLARVARRLLAFQAVGISQPACRSGTRGQARQAADPPAQEAAARLGPPGGPPP